MRSIPQGPYHPDRFDPASGPIILSEAFAIRALLCVTSFFLATVATYVTRKYLSFGPGAEGVPKTN
jgi:hypothetical protein